MIERFSIVKLVKNKYDADKVTEADPNPRVLVIRVYDDSRQYLVRYPSGYVHRVNEDWLTTKSIFEPDHPKYPTVANESYAIYQEYRKNTVYQEFLTERYPALAYDLQQKVEAKHRAYQARAQVAPVTLEEIVPALPTISDDTDNIIPLLISIDTSLKTLIQLWGGSTNVR